MFGAVAAGGWRADAWRRPGGRARAPPSRTPTGAAHAGSRSPARRAAHARGHHPGRGRRRAAHPAGRAGRAGQRRRGRRATCTWSCGSRRSPALPGRRSGCHRDPAAHTVGGRAGRDGRGRHTDWRRSKRHRAARHVERPSAAPARSGHSRTREGAPGDLYAEVQIMVPATLTDEERQLFEQLAAALHLRSEERRTMTTHARPRPDPHPRPA